MRKGKGKNMKELMENCKAMLLLEVIFSWLYVSSLHVYIVFSSATLCILYMEPSYLEFPMKYYKELGLLLCGFFLITGDLLLLFQLLSCYFQAVAYLGTFLRFLCDFYRDRKKDA